MNTKNTLTVSRTTDISNIVADATVIHRQLKVLEKKLDELKFKLRSYAQELISVNKGTERVEIQSNEGTCTISFTKEKLAIKAGVDVEKLKNESAFIWDTWFIYKPILKEDTINVYQTLQDHAPKLKFIVDQYLEVKKNAPTLTFAK